MLSLMWLRVIGAAGIMAGLYGGYQYIKHEGRVEGRAEVQAVFDKYKGAINDQVQAANEKAATTKLIQDAKYALAKSTYADDTARLNAALARLRNAQTVPGGGSVSVAGCSVDPMPATAGNTGGTVDAIEATAGIRCSNEFISNALKDTLQCSALITLVKSTQE